MGMPKATPPDRRRGSGYWLTTPKALALLFVAEYAAAVLVFIGKPAWIILLIAGIGTAIPASGEVMSWLRQKP